MKEAPLGGSQGEVYFPCHHGNLVKERLRLNGSRGEAWKPDAAGLVDGSSGTIAKQKEG